MALVDAHCHLQQITPDSARSEVFSLWGQLNVQRAVVNGTSPEDWPEVSRLCQHHPCCHASFGVHPWQVALVQMHHPDWLNTLEGLLDRHPNAGVGEIGLDNWVKDSDPVLQEAFFVAQWKLAAERNRPVTVHCLKAFKRLAELMPSLPRLKCGFLLHAYSSSDEMASVFSPYGAFYSYSLYFAHERKKALRETFSRLPARTLLVETDAPSMLPPEALLRYRLADGGGTPIHHPANLEVAYEQLALVRRASVGEIEAQIEANFSRFWSPEK